MSFLAVYYKPIFAIQIEKLEQVKAKERQGDRNDLVKNNTNIAPPVGRSKTVRKTKHILEKAPEEVIEK